MARSIDCYRRKELIRRVEAVVTTTVSSLSDLVAAAGDETVRRIVVEGEIRDAPSLRLAPNQQLVGAGEEAAIVFVEGADGLQLSRDNEVEQIRLLAEPRLRAVFNDTSVDDLGRMRLTGVSAVGQVQILARDRVRGGQITIDGLDVIDADVRDREDRPHLLGVGVVQGAFTLWNLQPDPEAILTARLTGISAGRVGAPVRGSGIFVGGADGSGGSLEVDVLETGPVFSNAGIREGTHDMIAGGVFVIYGSHVGRVRNRGPVTTYGVNDMALDNWGSVDEWTAEAPITTHGRSGVGFVNFGTMTSLRVEAPIETHGIGARGFNLYTGATLDEAEFERITTHADAAIGIQIGQPLGRIIVRDGIHTQGGAGDSLVKGVITSMTAHALSVLPDGSVDSVVIEGAVTTAGPGVVAVDVRGEVGAMRVGGGIHAEGSGSDALHVDGGTLGLRDTDVVATDGAAIRLTGATISELRGVKAHGPAGDFVVDQDSIIRTTVDTSDLSTRDGNHFTITGPAELRLVPEAH
jgi:hypothetical protein